MVPQIPRRHCREAGVGRERRPLTIRGGSFSRTACLGDNVNSDDVRQGFRRWPHAPPAFRSSGAGGSVSETSVQLAHCSTIVILLSWLHFLGCWNLPSHCTAIKITNRWPRAIVKKHTLCNPFDQRVDEHDEIPSKHRGQYIRNGQGKH